MSTGIEQLLGTSKNSSLRGDAIKELCSFIAGRSNPENPQFASILDCFVELKEFYPFNSSALQ
jgi:hypothetical protein